MTKYLSYIALLLCLSFVATSCSTDDNNITPTNTVTFVFDHKMFGEDLKYNTTYSENSNGEKINVAILKYIVSNFQLTTTSGKVFTYPKNNGYFFIDSETNEFKVVLEKVPAGNYAKVKFGVGVDQDKYLRGENNQQEFWDLCMKHDLTWNWITGYKFLNYQGVFIKDGVEEKGFQLHIGSHGTSQDNYRETTLTAVNPIAVSEVLAANVILNVEVSKILDSTNKVKLLDKPFIMVDNKLAPQIMENAVTMFSISKVEKVTTK